MLKIKYNLNGKQGEIFCISIILKIKKHRVKKVFIIIFFIIITFQAFHKGYFHGLVGSSKSLNLVI